MQTRCWRENVKRGADKLLVLARCFTRVIEVWGLNIWWSLDFDSHKLVRVETTTVASCAVSRLPLSRVRSTLKASSLQRRRLLAGRGTLFVAGRSAHLTSKSHRGTALSSTVTTVLLYYQNTRFSELVLKSSSPCSNPNFVRDHCLLATSRC